MIDEAQISKPTTASNTTTTTTTSYGRGGLKRRKRAQIATPTSSSVRYINHMTTVCDSGDDDDATTPTTSVTVTRPHLQSVTEIITGSLSSCSSAASTTTVVIASIAPLSDVGPHVATAILTMTTPNNHDNREGSINSSKRSRTSSYISLSSSNDNQLQEQPCRHDGDVDGVGQIKTEARDDKDSLGQPQPFPLSSSSILCTNGDSKRTTPSSRSTSSLLASSSATEPDPFASFLKSSNISGGTTPAEVEAPNNNNNNKGISLMVRTKNKLSGRMMMQKYRIPEGQKLMPLKFAPDPTHGPMISDHQAERVSILTNNPFIVTWSLYRFVGAIHHPLNSMIQVISQFHQHLVHRIVVQQVVDQCLIIGACDMTSLTNL
jgi:hypothetical protein